MINLNGQGLIYDKVLIDKSNKNISFNHSPMRRCDQISNYVMSHQNPTICWYSLMHRKRKNLSNIGTRSASLKHACWAAVRMLYLY